MVTGRIHSTETCGTVDGPGIRFVAFLQGCHLRCQYCHNPDTWNLSGGDSITSRQLMDEALRYRTYMRASGGGITLSGGEPLLQPQFVDEVFQICRDEGVHTALDTSGHCQLDAVSGALDKTNLVLLDWKAQRSATYQTVTGVSMDPVILFADYLAEKNIPVWIRFVQVPGLTDDRGELEEMAIFLTRYLNIQRVDINPFHKMGEYKWKQMRLSYKLQEIPPAHNRDVERTKELFRSYGFYTP